MLTCLLSCGKAYPNSLDSIINPIIPLLINRLHGKCHTTTLKIKVLECGMAAIYYHPELVVSVLHTDLKMTEIFFASLFDMLPKMEHDSTERLVVLAMTSLLSLPSNTLPKPAQMNLPVMFMQIIRELVLIEEENDRSEKDEDEEEDDDDGTWNDICYIVILICLVCMITYIFLSLIRAGIKMKVDKLSAYSDLNI